MALHNLVGQEGEDLALNYLENLGYKLIERNFRVFEGEIDLIMQNEEVLVFIEVRRLKKILNIHPLESFSRAKKSKLLKAINVYLYKNKLDLICRLDLLLVLGEPPKFEHFINI